MRISDWSSDVCSSDLHYFVQSEQIPSFVRIAVRSDEGQGHLAAGLLVQHLPEGEEGRERLHVRLDHPEWEHVHVLAETLKNEELTDPNLPLAEIVWRLVHEAEEDRGVGRGVWREREWK